MVKILIRADPLSSVTIRGFHAFAEIPVVTQLGDKHRRSQYLLRLSQRSKRRDGDLKRH